MESSSVTSLRRTWVEFASSIFSMNRPFCLPVFAGVGFARRGYGATRRTSIHLSRLQIYTTSPYGEDPDATED